MKLGPPSDKPIAVPAATSPAQPKGSQSTRASAGVGAGAAATAAKGSQAAGVAVTVSSLARTLEAGNRGDSADIDMQKVNAVRAAIQQGTYKVNPEAIADKLLSNAQEMLDRSRA